MIFQVVCGNSKKSSILTRPLDPGVLINHQPTAKKSYRSIIGRELLAGAALGILFPFGLGLSQRRADRIKNQRTIVLIHGYGGNRSSLYPLAAYLRLCGFKKILFYDYSSRRGIEQAAIGLKVFLKQKIKGGRIDLVCHSMGGLVARTYIQLLGGARRVDHCVTLGSPHSGTYNAYWLPNRVGEELRPHSSILQKLAATFTNSGNIKFCSILGGSDNIVLPRDLGPFADALVIPDCGHWGLLVSKAVMDEVVKFLLPEQSARSSIWSPLWPKKIS
jgi:hypothetical protein